MTWHTLRKAIRIDRSWILWALDGCHNNIYYPLKILLRFLLARQSTGQLWPNLENHCVIGYNDVISSLHWKVFLKWNKWRELSFHRQQKPSVTFNVVKLRAKNTDKGFLLVSQGIFISFLSHLCNVICFSLLNIIVLLIIQFRINNYCWI